MKRQWVAQVIADTTNEQFTDGDFDMCREWLLDQMNELWYHAEGHESFGAHLATLELDAASNEDDFSYHIGESVIRICSELVEEEEEA